MEQSYKEKYERALAKAKEQYNYPCMRSCMGILEEIFPELAESEDEKIRNGLVRLLKELLELGGVAEDEWDRNECEKYIAWLEKQDELVNSLSKGLDNAHERIDKLIQKNNELCVKLEKQGEPTDKGEISDGYHTFNELYYYRMLYNAAFFNMLPKECVHKSKKHHDGEECFGGGWFIVMANLPTGQISNHYELKDWNLFRIPEKEVADKWDGHTPQEAADRLYKYLLEKQVEQNQTDKIEPKFKVGDWVIDKQGIVHQITNVIENVTYHTYIVGGGYFNDNTEGVRLWTIKDVKDGDVICSEQIILLFKKWEYNNDWNFVIAYAGIDTTGKLQITDKHWFISSYAHPATKEQRDTLLKAMADAGYEWSDKDRKLIKIVK